MSLEVDVGLRLGAARIEAAFAAGRGVTALFGRSGAGKTSVVNAIAGLVRPERGRIAVDGATLFDAARGIDLPRHRRRVGYVFQEARLFPHLSVRRNLLYGRWFAPRGARGADLDEIVALLGIAPLLGRRPGTLSGGERQRVAIGRALLAAPRLLLLDEPLAGLDQERKDEILPYLERLRDAAAIPFVYVSHTLDEVIRLADTLVLLEEGRMVAAGPLPEVLAWHGVGAAGDRFEAGVLLSAKVARHVPEEGVTVLAHPAGELLVASLDAPCGASVRIRLRARDVALAVGEIGRISVRNRLRATVVDPGAVRRNVVDVRLDAGGEVVLARVTQAAVADLGLCAGQQVTALIKSVALEPRDVSPVAVAPR